MNLRASLALRLSRALAAVGLVVVAGCASDASKPTPLEPLTPTIAGSQTWKLGFSGFGPQGAIAAGGHVVVAATDGTLVSLDPETGSEQWRASVGGKLATGIGSDGRFAAVVTRDGELAVFDQGKALWRKRLDSAVVTAPYVAGERVFVLAVDRSIQAFDALDGSRLWTYNHPGDALTLSQAGVLTGWQDTLLAGQGARLAAIDPLHGTLRWEVPVAAPRGTNEVERLADLVGPASRVGDVYCMRAFQNGVGCIDARRATALWSINAGGSQAVGADVDSVYAADGSDRLSARRRASGESIWLSDKFQNRHLSGIASVGKVIVFGDLDGWVHFLDRTTGTPLLRLATDGSQVVGAPVLAGTTIVVTTSRGGLFAFRPE